MKINMTCFKVVCIEIIALASVSWECECSRHVLGFAWLILSVAEQLTLCPICHQSVALGASVECWVVGLGGGWGCGIYPPDQNRCFC